MANKRRASTFKVGTKVGNYVVRTRASSTGRRVKYWSILKKKKKPVKRQPIRGGGTTMSSMSRATMNMPTKDDIVFQSDNICILRPDCQAGALCFTRIYEDAIDCVNGIDKTKYPGYSSYLRKHNIFFRCATKLNPGVVPHPVTLAGELNAYFESYNLKPLSNRGIAVIRVDPDKTNIMYSEQRRLTPDEAFPVMSYRQFLNESALDKLNGHLKHTFAEIVYPSNFMPSEWFVYCRVASKANQHGVGGVRTARRQHTWDQLD